jgi:hypothetical protein
MAVLLSTLAAGCIAAVLMMGPVVGTTAQGTACTAGDAQQAPPPETPDRFGTISGMVQMADGSAAVGFRVFVFPKSWITQDGFRAIPIPVTTTEQGRFEQSGLPPMDYILLVSPGPQEATGVAREVSANEIDAVLRAVARGESTPPVSSGPSTSLVPMFYPASPLLRDAQTLSLLPASQIKGIVLLVDRVPSATLEVQVPGGNAENVRISLHHLDAPRTLGGRGTVQYGLAWEEVARFEHLAPGTYRVRAISTNQAIGGPGDAALKGEADVVVAPGGAASVVVELRSPMDFIGGLTVVGQWELPVSAEGLVVTLKRSPGEPSFFRAASIQKVDPLTARVSGGMFRFLDVPPGTYYVDVCGLDERLNPARTVDVRVTKDGTMLQTREITLKRGEQSGWAVILSNRAGGNIGGT